MNAAFDTAAHELEIHLRDVRHLVSDFAILPEGLETELGDLATALTVLDARVARLRGLLLGQGDPVPAMLPEDVGPTGNGNSSSRSATGGIDAPAGLSPAQRLAHLRELELTAAELGLPFDGAEEIAVLSAACSAQAASEGETDPGTGPAGRG